MFGGEHYLHKHDCCCHILQQLDHYLYDYIPGTFDNYITIFKWHKPVQNQLSNDKKSWFHTKD